MTFTDIKDRVVAAASAQSERYSGGDAQAAQVAG